MRGGSRLKLLSMQEGGLSQGDYKARGVVLRRRDGGKSQELLLFLSSHGVVRVSAPGAGSKNRFGAGTEPMVWGEFLLYQSTRSLYLKGVDVREGFWGVRGSRSALRMAVKWCGEVASRLMPGVESDNLLSLLWGSMKNLSNGFSPLLLDVRFAWRWGNLWGVAPPLDSCTSCGARIDGSSGLVARSSDGLLCADCGRAASESSGESRGSLPLPTLRTLRSAALLPKDAFQIWASESAASDAALSECPAWLYSFITLH
ncbi:MAG: DNA repair protein RecO [Synergistaceae bacterium]|jgi:DNA repair protein RecO (recombination protein O)|nr:DNA repair protein RecO [Synergistaceae bacterium]